jgi:hypothetical protein
MYEKRKIEASFVLLLCPSLSIPLTGVVAVRLVNGDVGDPGFELDHLPKLLVRGVLVGPHEHRYLPTVQAINQADHLGTK